MNVCYSFRRHQAIAHKRRDLRIARRIATRLRRSIGTELVEIRLFGSRAKNTARPDSDYDLFIVLRHRDAHVVDEIYRHTGKLELARDIESIVETGIPL